MNADIAEKIEWFLEKYGTYIHKEGWYIHSFGPKPSQIYIICPVFFREQHYISDIEAAEKAKRYGWIIDNWGENDVYVPVISDFDIEIFNENEHLLMGYELGLL